MRKLKAVLMMMALLGVLGSMAYAHDHDDDDDNRSWGQNNASDAREYGFHNGYRDGFRHGRTDRYQREGYDYRSDEFQSGMRGYDSNMGPRGQYRKGYREGYRAGYDDAYNGRNSQYSWVYGQNGRRTPWDPDGDGDVHSNAYPNQYPDQDPNGGYYQPDGTAQTYGYQDGLQAGQRDRAGRHSYRPTEWDAYKDADHGMSISRGYGSADNYKQAYRQAFMNGYNQGYRR